MTNWAQSCRLIERVAVLTTILLTVPLINIYTAYRLILKALLLSFRQTSASLSITVGVLQDSRDAVSLYLS